MGSDFTPRRLDYTCFLPNFRFSAYSELEGALGDMVSSTQITETLKNDICKDVSEPPELAMYTIGVYDDYDMEPVGSSITSAQHNIASHQRSGNALLGSHSEARPTHDVGYDVGLFYDCAARDTDLGKPSLNREQSPPTSNESPSHIEATPCEDDCINEAGNSCSATVRTTSPAASDVKSDSIKNVGMHISTLSCMNNTLTWAHSGVEEMVEIKIESSASPERVLSPLTTSASIQTTFRVPGYQPSHSSVKKKRTKLSTLLACYYCHGRKIRCGGRDEHDETRRQCQHRKQECQFPPGSNRGMRSNPETKSASKKARKVASKKARKVASTKPTAEVTLAGIAEVV
ncbi:hypothetical protein NM688_g8473 [Phlebia brevispora]|uniref:Uncharacterized protein n=1 Tax=Phlebia brevispora TaxID=194682 RepID=A0ACC1RRP5_9APHY|nr:hypothetical protein NM688_g8473 [Phlebia brevispora]